VKKHENRFENGIIPLKREKVEIVEVRVWNDEKGAKKKRVVMVKKRETEWLRRALSCDGEVCNCGMEDGKT
jgi:hypothetical protein